MFFLYLGRYCLFNVITKLRVHTLIVHSKLVENSNLSLNEVLDWSKIANELSLYEITTIVNSFRLIVM